MCKLYNIYMRTTGVYILYFLYITINSRLVCQIFYTSPYFDINTLDSNSPKSIKKTYRFPALPPFKIHHRLHFVPVCL